MSSNDPNEYLKFLIQQQQQAQRQQAQGGAADRRQPGAVPSADLGNLVAEYLRASSASTSGNGTTATPFASLMSSASPPAPNNVDSVQQQQQQLLASAKLLSSVNPSLAAAAVEHAMALVQPALQQQQGIPPHLHQHGTQVSLRSYWHRTRLVGCVSPVFLSSLHSISSH